MTSQCDDKVIDFERNLPLDDKLLKEIKVEAKSMGIFEHNIYDSEEDEDFILSEINEDSSDDEDISSDEIDKDGNKQNEAIDNKTEKVNQELELLFSNFRDWMESCEGGERKVDSAEQNITQAKVILRHVDPDNMQVSQLVDRFAVRNKWLMPFKNSGRRPGTIMSYCNSLRLLMDYLIISKEYKDLRMDDMQSMQTQARVWAKSLNKQTKAREFEKIYEDFADIIDPAEVKTFERSEPCRQAVKILEKFSTPLVGIAPMQNEFTLVRDFLLWQISIDNGGRPGPFMDLTLHEFANATKESVDNSDGSVTECSVINIFDHKTSSTHGPARVVFSLVLYNWFTIFIKNIRGRFYGLPKSPESRIFVAHTGNAMISKNCSSRLTSLWGKGLQTRNSGKIRMNNTLIRKSLTTHIRKHHDDMKDAVADKLLHKISTSDRYYNVVRKGEEAVKTSLFLSSVFKGDPACNTEPTDKTSIELEPI